MKSFWVTLTVFALIAGVAVIYACGDDDDDDSGDDDDDDDEDSCPITGDGLTEAPGSGFAYGCDQIGLTLVADKILASSDLTRFEIQGQYAVGNDNSYILRGAGISAEGACFETIENSGTFTIRTEFLQCTDDFTIDVVTSFDPDAQPFCVLDVALSVSCPDDDDDDDTYWDDDDDDIFDDDDDYYDCQGGENAFGFLMNDCGFVFTDQDGYELSFYEMMLICDACIITCYDSYDNCDDMADCIIDACL
jgi:hypothetical protein